MCYRFGHGSTHYEYVYHDVRINDAGDIFIKYRDADLSSNMKLIEINYSQKRNNTVSIIITKNYNNVFSSFNS